MGVDRRAEASRPEAAYNLHTSSGVVPISVRGIEKLKVELAGLLERGEFEAEAQKRRWMPVSNSHGTLAGRIDLRATRDNDRFADLFCTSGGALSDLGRNIDPYVLHTRKGDVATAAWTAHEFQMELERLLDEGRLRRDACLRCWNRVTQGCDLVGHAEPSANRFVLRPKALAVGYWLRHASGSLPLLATTTDELCEELRALCQSGEFIKESTRGESLEVWTTDGGDIPGRFLGRVATNSGGFTTAPPTARNYDVHRPKRAIGSEVGRLSISRLSLDGSNGLEELRLELRRLLFEGEFQTEEDDGLRWLPVTQDGQLVGHLDPVAREFCGVEEQRTATYTVTVGQWTDLPMVAETVEELRSELAERFEDLSRLTYELGGWEVKCKGGLIGVFDHSVGFLRDRTFEIRQAGRKEPPEGATCAACRYWRFEKERVAYRHAERLDAWIVREGRCKRSFPHPRRGWPTTVENDWCGEFEAANP